MPGENSSHITHYSPSPPAEVGSSLSSSATPVPGRVVVALPGDPTPARHEDKTVISHRPPIGEFAPQQMPLLNSSNGQSLVGKTLDHYQLLEFVGGGGMGAVYRANDTRLGRTVAVKVLTCDHTDTETIRRFQNEAQSAARLDHPNIARAYFVGESQGWNYIVFEFVDGINLRDLVAERGPLPIEDALDYTLQVAAALEHSSSRDVVHRDIKPSNVLVTASGVIKLVDMGLARLHQVESSSDDLTASGVTLGTFDYISPEQARDPRAADVRSDIYSLGCTLYYMLVGQPPFPEGTAVQKLLRHSSDEPPDVRLFRPDIPPQVVSLLGKLLAKRPSQRHQTPSDLIADLVHLGQQLGIDRLALGDRVVHAAPAASDWRSQTLQVILATAALAILIVAVDAWLSSDGAGEFKLRSNLPAPPPSVAAESPNLSPSEPERDIQPAPTAVVSPSSPEVAAVGSSADADVTSKNGSEKLLPAPTDVQPRAVPAAPATVTAATPQTVAPNETSTAIVPDPLGLAIGIEPATTAVSLAAESSVELQAPGPVTKIRRLAVAPQPPMLVPADTRYVSTIAEACRLAAELGIGEIELAWNGRLQESSLEITSPRLTLKAVSGYQPVLVFSPSVGLGTARQMIRLAGSSSSRLTLQGLELRLELPAEPADGWSLLTLGTGQSLELSDCVLTVQDGNESRPAVHDQVAMIAVQSRRTDAMMMGQAQPAMASPTTLSLHRCIARGEANVIGMIEETPLSIHWNQGLIATSRHLLETGGSISEPTRFESIAINLARVTASCRQGLYLMKRGTGSAYQLAVEVMADHCIFITEPGAPLYEFVGVHEVAPKDLHCEGQNNLYPSAEAIFLRYRSGQPGDVASEFAVKDRALVWSDERNLQRGEPWRQPLDLSLPAHARSKDEFQIDSAMTIDVGFDPAALPATTSATEVVNEPAALPPSE